MNYYIIILMNYYLFYKLWFYALKDSPLVPETHVLGAFSFDTSWLMRFWFSKSASLNDFDLHTEMKAVRFDTIYTKKFAQICQVSKSVQNLFIFYM